MVKHANSNHGNISKNEILDLILASESQMSYRQVIVKSAWPVSDLWFLMISHLTLKQDVSANVQDEHFFCYKIKWNLM